jgi:hypothetical protein
VLNSVLSSAAASSISAAEFALCTAASLVLGAVIALLHLYRGNSSKQFAITLALLPVIVQVIITMVGGNLGTGVAVAGAFSLVRFRSVPGSGRDICSVFLAMAVGLATGTGYLTIAAILTAVVGLASLLYLNTRFGESRRQERELIVTIPENLDYTGLFDDLFVRYTACHELVRVKTSNMGSLYKLTYHITLQDPEQEKQFLDDLRCRNGNLDIVCGKRSTEKVEL